MVIAAGNWWAYVSLDIALLNYWDADPNVLQQHHLGIWTEGISVLGLNPGGYVWTLNHWVIELDFLGLRFFEFISGKEEGSYQIYEAWHVFPAGVHRAGWNASYTALCSKVDLIRVFENVWEHRRSCTLMIIIPPFPYHWGFKGQRVWGRWGKVEDLYRQNCSVLCKQRPRGMMNFMMATSLQTNTLHEFKCFLIQGDVCRLFGALRTWKRIWCWIEFRWSGPCWSNRIWHGIEASHPG